jgi:GNAT superfamily N-acetyltransferase
VAITWSETLDGVDWNELEALYRAAPLGNKPAAFLRTVFTNSMFRCLAYEDGRLVGAGRVLADGADCAYVCDIALLPSHQGRGLGRVIIDRLLAAARGHKKIILYSVPGKEAFYRRAGFWRMRTAMAIFADQAAAAERGYIDET